MFRPSSPHVYPDTISHIILLTLSCGQGAVAEGVETLKLDFEVLNPLMEDWNNGIFALFDLLIFIGQKPLE